MGSFDPELQRRLRADRTSRPAVLCAAASGLPAVLVTVNLFLPRDLEAVRGSPLYWAAILAYVWWATSLVTFGGWSLRTTRPACFLFPILSTGALAYAYALHRGSTPYWVALALSLILSGLGLMLYRRSYLRTYLSGA